MSVCLHLCYVSAVIGPLCNKINVAPLPSTLTTNCDSKQNVVKRWVDLNVKEKGHDAVLVRVMIMPSYM